MPQDAAVPRHPRRRWGWTALALLALLGILAWRFWHHETPPAAPPPAAVTAVTAVVAAQDLPRYLTGIGTVQATTSVTVRVRVDGQLERIDFNEGQDVKAGDVLAQIDPRPLRAQLEQVRAAKARDAAQLANARVDLQRYLALAEQGASSRQQADTQAALVKQLDAAVQTDQAAVDYAAVQLGYTTIRSPISGRTGVRLIDVGNIVHAADANGLVVVNQIDPITVLFTLPEDAVGRVNAAMQEAGGQPLVVDVYPRDGTQKLAAGKLTLVNNQIDTTTGTVSLKATFDNPKHVLWPGQYVNVRLEIGTLKQAVAVETSVIQRGPNGPFVFVVKADDTAAVQPVRLGATQGSQTVIEDGLAPGTRVVVDGQLKLRAGVKVKEAPARADAGGAPATGAGAASSAAATSSAASARPAAAQP